MSENLLPKDDPLIEAEEETSMLVYLMNIFLVVVIVVLIYKIIRGQQSPQLPPPQPQLPQLKKRDFTLEELKPYNGTGEEGRILIGCNGKVFDVTRGKRFYGPEGPYAAFAGKDASRAFATFSVTVGKDEYDDLSDLTPSEWESVREWEQQFTDKYDHVGKLLKPGEKHTQYENEEQEQKSAEEKKDL